MPDEVNGLAGIIAPILDDAIGDAACLLVIALRRRDIEERAERQTPIEDFDAGRDAAFFKPAGDAHVVGAAPLDAGQHDHQPVSVTIHRAQILHAATGERGNERAQATGRDQAE